jgi:glycosyltransferase involved in cell wall biosynthesis
MEQQYTMTNKYDLSILIPARNEEWLSRTVANLLENIQGNTEIIVVLDGAWADPGIVDHERVTIVYLSESVGQRAATNIACKLSKAKYVMKCDAHTVWDKGFDVKMMADMQDDYTMVPVMMNLHAFDWVCPDGHRRYQGPSGVCRECGKPTEKDVIFAPRKRTPHSTAYRFDTKMHFQYHNEWKNKQEGDLVETLSLQGSCFMLTREKYWELNICDESWGSWGQQGVEVAVKTWLSGGRVLVNKKTWYAHLFRTQGGDFSFPYKQRPESEIIALREFTKDLFMNNKWPLAKHTFQWLLDKFKPLPGWHDNRQDKDIGDMEIPDENRKGIIFYTDNRLNLKIAHAVQKQLKKAGLPIISASLKPMTFGDKNVVIDEPRGYKAYFEQIIAALETSTAEIVFFCEHDVLYHPSHFEFTPPKKDKFYYNQNVVRVEWGTGRAVSWDANQVAELVCYRELALDWYKKKLAQFESGNFDRKFEPQGENDDQFETWRSKEPNIDIRHGQNLTKTKWSIDDFRDKRTAANFRECEVPNWAKNLIPVEKS